MTPKAEASKSKSPPSTPRTNRTRSQRKVTFAPFTEVVSVPSLSDAEDTAQCRRFTERLDPELSDSESSSSDGEVQPASPSTIPVVGNIFIGLRLLTDSQITLQQENNDSGSALPEAEIQRSIMMWDCPVSSEYNAILTKKLLAEAPVAPGVFRLMDDDGVEVQRARRKKKPPVDAPMDDAPDTTLVPEDCGTFPADNDDGGIEPSESQLFCDEGAGSTGFYEDGEDRYAG